jgi:hypothetical protein
LRQLDVGAAVVVQLDRDVVLVDDDGTEALARDDGRRLAVERDADAQRAGAVQQLAGERDRDLAIARRLRRGRQDSSRLAVSKRFSITSTQGASP